MPTLIFLIIIEGGRKFPTPSRTLLLMAPSLFYNSPITSALNYLDSEQMMDPVENFEAMFDMEPDWFERPPVPAKDVKRRLPPSSSSSSSSQLLSIKESTKEAVSPCFQSSLIVTGLDDSFFNWTAGRIVYPHLAARRRP